MDFLTRLRLKSPLVRMQYAIGAASVVTGVIALVWLSTLPARFAAFEDSETATTSTFRANSVLQAPKEEPAVYEGTTEGFETLNGVQIGSTSTATTTRDATHTATTSRAIQIGTTSQNRN